MAPTPVPSTAIVPRQLAFFFPSAHSLTVPSSDPLSTRSGSPCATHTAVTGWSWAATSAAHFEPTEPSFRTRGAQIRSAPS